VIAGEQTRAPRRVKVVFVAEDVSVISGGAPAVVRQLSGKLVACGVQVHVLYSKGDATVLPAGVHAYSFPPSHAGRLWGWGRGLRVAVNHLSIIDDTLLPLFHLHGVWSAPQYFAAVSSRANRTPFIVSTHGMLEPWLWNKQGWRVMAKKRVYWTSLAYPALRHAKAIHAITPMERDNLAKLFPRNRIEVIPNAIDIPDAALSADVIWEKKILYLGRIEPKKGVDILLNAFIAARIDKEWTLEIAGPFWSEVFRRKLDNIVQQSGIGHRIRFLGPVSGETKQRLIDTAWVMAVPSHSEVVGLVNLEAAVSGLPTITTHQTGLFDWESGGGILINLNIEALRRSIEAACSWSDAERSDRGRASRRLVEQRYSWRVVMPLWLSLYDSLHGDAPCL